MFTIYKKLLIIILPNYLVSTCLSYQTLKLRKSVMCYEYIDSWKIVNK